MSQNKVQQLREELLLEFDFTAPGNWGEKALAKKLAELQAERDATATDVDAKDAPTGTESADVDAKDAPTGTESADVDAKDAPTNTEAASVDTKAAPTETKPTVNEAAESEKVLMVTLVNHQVPGCHDVRAKHEKFYTDEPDTYAGVAKRVE